MQMKYNRKKDRLEIVFHTGDEIISDGRRITDGHFCLDSYVVPNFIIKFPDATMVKMWMSKNHSIVHHTFFMICWNQCSTKSIKIHIVS